MPRRQVAGVLGGGGGGGDGEIEIEISPDEVQAAVQVNQITLQHAQRSPQSAAGPYYSPRCSVGHLFFRASPAATVKQAMVAAVRCRASSRSGSAVRETCTRSSTLCSSRWARCGTSRAPTDNSDKHASSCSSGRGIGTGTINGMNCMDDGSRFAAAIV